MSILSVQFGNIGAVPGANPNNGLPAAQQTPQLVYIATNDTNATVTTAGYLNTLTQNTTEGFVFSNTQMALVYTTDDGVQFYQVSVAAGTGIITLVPDVNPGNVLLPVAVNHIAVFSNIAGQIADPAGTAIHGGSIQAGTTAVQGSLIAFGAANAGANDKLTISYVTSAGNRGLTLTNAAMGQATTITMPDPGVAAAQYILNNNAGTQIIATGSLTVSNGSIAAGNAATPTAGTLTSFPASSGGANDKLVLSATTSGGNFTTTITNAAQAASRIYTIPDGGAASSFLLTNSGGTQTIATGSLALTVGSVTATAGNFVAGNAAGPNAGNFQSFPAASGGANDKLVVSATTAGGNFTTTLTNRAMGQSSTISFADPGNANGSLLIAATTTPFTANHSLVASGTGGLIADAGYQMKVVAQAAVAGGAAAQTVVDAFCTTASMVTGSWNDTSNAVTIQKIAAGNGSFVVTSSADPGASHLNYIITKV